MLEKLLSPFVEYWYWAQSRGTSLTKGLALGAPLVAFALVLYLLFGRGGDDNSLLPDPTSTQGNIAGATPGITPTEPASAPTSVLPTATIASTGGAPVSGDSTPGATPPAQPSGTAAPETTAFTQLEYEVEAGDNPGLIAEKVGVPADARTAWIQEMLALNGVTETTLQLGQKLILPPF